MAHCISSSVIYILQEIIYSFSNIVQNRFSDLSSQLFFSEVLKWSVWTISYTEDVVNSPLYTFFLKYSDNYLKNLINFSSNHESGVSHMKNLDSVI